MPPEESIAVAPSAESGNVPVDTETPAAPSEPSEPATPTDPKEPETPAEPVVELFELPDGRKVDAETLSKEWKENFYPDYTRKSQELSKVKETILPAEKPTNPYADPNYSPQTYEEIIQAAEQRAIKAIEGREQARIEQQKAIEDAVSGQLSELKKTDPTLNENALFVHATKYGFRDLKQAHQNMRDMSELVKKTQKTTADNITKRTDPVSVSPGAAGTKLDPSHFSSAVDYLRALKGQ